MKRKRLGTSLLGVVLATSIVGCVGTPTALRDTTDRSERAITADAGRLEAQAAWYRRQRAQSAEAGRLERAAQDHRATARARATAAWAQRLEAQARAYLDVD